MNSRFRKRLPGTALDYFDAREAVDALHPDAWAGLPYTARVHAENIVRLAAPARVDEFLMQIMQRRRDSDFPWFPGRVVHPDLPEQAAQTDPGAEMLALLARVKPAYSRVIEVQDGVSFPDSCIGTGSPTVAMGALGIVAIDAGGEPERANQGSASWMRLPDTVGVRLTGQRQPHATVTDMAVALTEHLRQHGVEGTYLEFFGDGARSLTIVERATVASWCTECGATAALFPIDNQTLDHLRLTVRDGGHVGVVEAYAQEAGFWVDSMLTAAYERMLSFDLSTVG